MENANKEVAKKVILEIEGKEYTLEYNRASIKQIEQKGFSMINFNTQLMTSIDLMIEGALYKNQKYLTPKDIDKIITYIYNEVNVSDLVEVLSEMLREALPMFDAEEGVEKKGFQDSEVVHYSFTKAMEDLCAVALGWGMPWDLYWYGETSAVLPYYEKWKREYKVKQIQLDTDAWLLGKYIQIAVSSVLSKDVTYPNQPYYLEHLQKEQKTAEEVAQEQFMQLDSWKRVIKQNIRNEKKER